MKNILSKFDPRNPDTFLKLVDEDLINDDSLEFSKEQIKNWIYLAQNDPQEARKKVADAARFLQILLYFSKFIDPWSEKENDLELLNEFGLSEKIKEEELYEQRIDRFLKGDVFSSPHIIETNKLVICSPGTLIYKTKDGCLVIAFEVWHPQRDVISHIFFHLEEMKVLIQESILKSLFQDFSENKFVRISNIVINNFLRSPFHLPVTKENNHEINLWLYGSAHFGHFILNTLAQVHRLSEVLNNRESNEKSINLYIFYTGKNAPDFIDLEKIQEKVNKKIRLYYFHKWVQDLNNIGVNAFGNNLVLGLSGCRIHNDFGEFSRDILLDKESKNRVKTITKKINSEHIKLCLGVRCGSRELINQLSLYTSLVDELAKDCSHLDIIIDGMFKSDSANVSSTTLLDKSLEVEVSERIIELIQNTRKKNVSVKSIVGLSLSEQIEEISSCDFVVAPLGSGFAKYQWISDIPGISFGPLSAIESFEKHSKNVTRNGVGLNFNAAYLDRMKIKAYHRILPQCCLVESSKRDYRGNFSLNESSIIYIREAIKAIASYKKIEV